MEETNRLYQRYQLARNGFLPEQVFSLAYLRLCLRDRLLNAALRHALVVDMDQARWEEAHTPHGAITENVKTTRPLPPSGPFKTITMDTDELR